MHKPESVLEKEKYKINWNFKLFDPLVFQTQRLYQVLIDKK